MYNTKVRNNYLKSYMMRTKYKFILVLLLFLFYGSNLSVSSQNVNKIDYAYETLDSLVFYGNTAIPLRCMLSTELIFQKKPDNSISLVKVNIDRMDVRRVLDNKKIDFISKYINSKRASIFDSMTKHVYSFLKKQEIKIYDASKKYMKGMKGSIYLKTGLFLWIYIYPNPQEEKVNIH